MKKITDVNHVALLPAGRGGEYAVVLDKSPEDKRVTVFDLFRGSIFDRARAKLKIEAEIKEAYKNEQ